MTRATPIGVLVLAVSCLSWPAAAQTNERVYENLDFRFLTPGARPAGMGLTFVGLADDATAAASNPAGLSNLLEPEFSLEFAGSRTHHQRLTSTTSLDYSSFGQPVWVLPSFVSLAVPRGSFTISGFANNEQDYKESFQFDGRCNSPTQCEDGAFGQIDAVIWNYGGSVAWLAASRLSVGGSIVATHLSLEAHGRSGSPTSVKNGTDTDDSGWAPSAFLGLLAKPWNRTTFGIAYYRGATFHLMTHVFGDFERVGPKDEMRPIDYVLPSKISLGGSFRFRDWLTGIGEVARINYSERVTKNFLVVDFMFPSAALSAANYSYRDVNEYHGGVEARLVRSGTVIAIRGGVFSDPQHHLHFSPQGGSLTADTVEAFRFNSSPDKTHVGGTTGVGFTLNNQFQLDFAFTAVQDSKNLILSIVRRWPR
ncbi:MAG TPA: hypothetical protein VJN96_02700 [Vicinamibacterales bacterium]|nr:hypothetical protein [Vicinamibacterales bacterium]